MLAQFIQSSQLMLQGMILFAVLCEATGCHHSREAGLTPTTSTTHQSEEPPEFEKLLTYQYGEVAKIEKVPTTGVYTLYCNDVPVTSRFLVAGTPIGFEHNDGGVPQAIAADARLTITGWPHYWRLTKPDKAMLDEHQIAHAAALREMDQKLNVVGTALYPIILYVGLPLGLILGHPSF